MQSNQVTSKWCSVCLKDTPHWDDTGTCTACDDREGRAALAATRAAKKKAKIRKKRAKSKKKTPEELAKYAAKREESEKTRQELARREIARRELARRNLLAFVKRYEPTYMAGWVHKVICEELMAFSEAVARGESPRLMITMPPRHGKSMLASQYFPAWHLGRHPDHEFINASYAQSLQMDFSRKIQELVRTPDYQLLFDGLKIMKNNEAVERWGLADKTGIRTGGGVLAAGVGGPITGRGAHVLIIDDPVKNREEAESQTVREGAKAWYSSTAYTRLAPGGGVLVIQTRWHDDDLAGWLLSEMREAEKEMVESGEWPEDADNWRVINFPAIAKEHEKYRRRGEALHPDRYPLKALRKIKRTLSPRDWAALYQQDPQVEEGAYFKKKWVRHYSSNPPKYMDFYAAGDLAISKKEYADYSVFIVAGLDENENVYMIEEFRGRWSSNEIIDVMFEIQRRYKPRIFALEKGHISLTMEDLLNRRKREEKMYDLHIEEMAPGKSDKQLRARSFQGLMQLGRIFWPEGSLWVDEHTNELLRFPSGVKDDRVDADAWLGKILVDQRYIGSDRPKKRDKSWKKKLAGYVSGHRDVKSAMAA